MFRLATLCGVSAAALMPHAAAHAQVAPVPYLDSFGFSGSSETQFWGSAPDEDGFRKGFSFQSFSTPVSTLGSSYALGNLGAFGNSGGLISTGAQYGYSFKGVGDLPVTMFGSVGSLRQAPDVFTSLVTPGFERSNTLATSVNAGIAFKPTSNISLSLSAGYVQSSPTTDTDLRSQLISGGLR